MTQAVEFTGSAENFREWMDGAERAGQTRQAAYAAWRKVWFCEVNGADWSRRRKGVKSKRTRYRDASTCTEEVAS